MFLILGVFLAFSLTACGDASESESPIDASDSEKSDGQDEAVKPEEDKADKPGEKDTDKRESSKDNSFYADVFKESLPYISEEQLELNQESYDFINSNSNLLPAKTDEDIQLAKEKSETVDIKVLNKNSKPYHSTLTSFEGYVVQVFEEEYDNGETESFVNVGDENGNNYIILLYKGTGDILEEDYVQFWGLPVGNFSYETLDGGHQIAQIFFGSHIEKK